MRPSHACQEDDYNKLIGDFFQKLDKLESEPDCNVEYDNNENGFRFYSDPVNKTNAPILKLTYKSVTHPKMFVNDFLYNYQACINATEYWSNIHGKENEIKEGLMKYLDTKA